MNSIWLQSQSRCVFYLGYLSSCVSFWPDNIPKMVSSYLWTTIPNLVRLPKYWRLKQTCSNESLFVSLSPQQQQHKTNNFHATRPSPEETERWRLWFTVHLCGRLKKKQHLPNNRERETQKPTAKHPRKKSRSTSWKIAIWIEETMGFWTILQRCLVFVRIKCFFSIFYYVYWTLVIEYCMSYVLSEEHLSFYGLSLRQINYFR